MFSSKKLCSLLWQHDHHNISDAFEQYVLSVLDDTKLWLCRFSTMFESEWRIDEEICSKILFSVDSKTIRRKFSPDMTSDTVSPPRWLNDQCWSIFIFSCVFRFSRNTLCITWISHRLNQYLAKCSNSTRIRSALRRSSKKAAIRSNSSLVVNP